MRFIKIVADDLVWRFGRSILYCAVPVPNFFTLCLLVQPVQSFALDIHEYVSLATAPVCTTDKPVTITSLRGWSLLQYTVHKRRSCLVWTQLSLQKYAFDSKMFTRAGRFLCVHSRAKVYFAKVRALGSARFKAVPSRVQKSSLRFVADQIFLKMRPIH